VTSVPRFNFRAELSESFLRNLLDQLNRMIGQLEEVTGLASKTLVANEVLLAGGSVQLVRLVNLSTSSVTVTLPLAVLSTDARIMFKIIARTAPFALTVQRAGTDTIDGAVSVVRSALWDSFTLTAVNGSWYIL